MKKVPIITVDGRRINGAVKPYINTVLGRARYKETEVEDEYENWSNRYSTNRGEFVIHKGKRHHIYEVEPTYKCDICGAKLSREEEYHGNCPKCGASAFERHTTRKTKQRMIR
jgi:predicted RNA-binding Zn-ribbon protein involved in translation (DUF1610 family)